MRINSKQAASLFFPSTSLEFVYFEAIANSIDAEADLINIEIEIKTFVEAETLHITIKDNGNGFNDRNFQKFNNVLDTEDKAHKGIGRLVFLNYFNEVIIESYYNKNKRIFTFNEAFDGENEKTEIDDETKTTILKFKDYKKNKINTYDYLIPSKLKNSILQHFLPRFYRMKLENKKLVIKISLKPKENDEKSLLTNSSDELDISKLPDLKEKTIPDTTSIFGYFKLLYSVERVYANQSVISAICADGRTIPMEIISNKDFPSGYKMVFILYSDYFDGKTDTAREKISLDDSALKHVRKMFTKLISEVIKEEIPTIIEHNNQVQENLQNQYPHLLGYFDDDSIGLVDKSQLVIDAQGKFFYDQKEILEATSLDDDQYEKSLIYSSRILTEYILYRKKIIDKLKTMNANNDESEIHDLIVPRKKKYFKSNHLNIIFTNNAWVLDDKYMSYH